MRAFKLFAFALFAYILQVTILPRFALFGVTADILLVLTTLFAVTYGAEKGFILGFLFGMLQDIFMGGYYINAFSKALLGFLVGTFKESVIGNDNTVSLAAVFVATVTNFMVELTMLFFFFGKPLASPQVLLITLFLSCLYNVALTPLLYPVVKLTSSVLSEQ